MGSCYESFSYSFSPFGSHPVMLRVNLAQHIGVGPARLGGESIMRCWGLDPGWPHARHVLPTVLALWPLSYS